MGLLHQQFSVAPLSPNLGPVAEGRFANDWKVKRVNPKCWVVGRKDGKGPCFSVGGHNGKDIAFYVETPAEVFAALKQGDVLDASYHEQLPTEKHLGVTLPRILREKKELLRDLGM